MGKFSDKFLNAFSLRDDDDDFDDEEEYEEDYDEEYDDEEYDDEEPESRGFFRKKAPAREPAPRPSRSNSEVCIFKPSSIEDAREITETLLQGKAVVINFEGLHVEISQRIIDFISGSCYALDGNLQKISNYIFIATPDSVDISGDFQNLFSNNDGSFEMSEFKSPLI